MRKAVAIVSGGLDSIGYATIWKNRGAEIYPIIFNYGQKAYREIEIALNLCRKLGFNKPKVIDISSVIELWKGSQLTDNEIQVQEEYAPSVVVPLRNALFLVIATIYAISIDAEYLLYGAHSDDCKHRPNSNIPMYPDCTPDFAKTLEKALNIGHFWQEGKITFSSPSIEGLSKSMVLKQFYEIAGDIVYETYSCYLSGDRHCGRCESDMNRHRAFIEAGIIDKTEYVTHPKISRLCESGSCGAKN